MSSPSTSILGAIKNAFVSAANAVEGAVAAALPVVAKVLPFLSPFLPASIVGAIQSGTGELSAIATIITGVEATSASMGAAATASAKAAAALPGEMAIVQAWLQGGLPGSAKVQDQAMFEQGVSQLNTAMVTILNSVGD